MVSGSITLPAENPATLITADWCAEFRALSHP
jgi:hypothetical protein